MNCSISNCHNCSSPEVCDLCVTGFTLDTMANECKRMYSFVPIVTSNEVIDVEWSRHVEWLWIGVHTLTPKCLDFYHWLHWKLLKWQPPVQPVINISSKWHFRFSVCIIILSSMHIFFNTFEQNFASVYTFNITLMCHLSDREWREYFILLIMFVYKKNHVNIEVLYWTQLIKSMRTMRSIAHCIATILRWNSVIWTDIGRIFADTVAPNR